MKASHILLATAIIMVLAIQLLSLNPVHATLTSHAPIYINGNDNFTLTNGVTSGAGTSGNPWVIENWVINASSATGIYVTNTTDYVTIRNCLIENGGVTWSGIFITGASNITVFHNISDNNEEGIIMGNGSTNNTLDNNITFGNDDAGIVANYTSNDLIINNTSYGNTFEGMAIWNSSYDNIIGNVCANSKTAQGMTLKNDSNLLVARNTIHNNATRQVGIATSSLNNSIVAGNIIENNDSVGIFLADTSGYNSIENNTFSKNGNYGIGIQSGSTGNYIYHNWFLNNDVTPQASDGDSNYWDNGYPSGGNYWSDWQPPIHQDADNNGIVDNAYLIWRFSLDHYPLVIGGATLSDNTPPAAPQLSSPRDNSSTTNTRPTFSWSAVSDNGPVTYRIQVSANLLFTSPIENVAPISGTSYTSSALSVGTYYWRVQATDGAGNVGAFSIPYSIQIKSRPVRTGGSSIPAPTPAPQTPTSKPSGGISADEIIIIGAVVVILIRFR